MSDNGNNGDNRESRSWTIEEIQFLYDQKNVGAKNSDIARSLNRSENAVALKWRDFNWTAFENGDSGTKPWTEEDEEYLYNQRLRGINYRSIGRHLGRTFRSCRNKYVKTDWNDRGFTSSEASLQKQSDIEKFTERTQNTVDRALDRWRLRADILADAITKSAHKLPRAPLVKWKPRNKKWQDHSPEDMGLMFSDLHVGHEHSLDETGGISQYNVEIFQKRMKNLMYAVSDIYELHSSLYNIPKLNVFCLGDIVAGMNDVGAWSPVYINTPIMDQVMTGVRAMSDTIWYWLTIFDEIEFIGIRGNHGRIARSGMEKDYANWDIIVYMFLETEFRNNPRIKFVVPRTWWHMTEVRHHNFLLMHGDDVKSKQPPISAFLEEERKMAGFIGNVSHYTLAGHFHNASEMASTNGRVLMNGSFVGSDIYSLKNCLPGTRAEQKLFGIHEKRGITWNYNIDLDVDRGDDRMEGQFNDSASRMGKIIYKK